MSQSGASLDGHEQIDAQALIDRLASADWQARRTLVKLLADQGQPALAPLLHALRTRRDDEARIAALVDALSSSSGDADVAVAGLAEDPDPAIVADAAQILGRRRSSAFVPVLARLTKHADDNVAVGAIEALGKIGGQTAVEALVACVEAGNFFRTFPAIDVLGRSGDPRAVEPLARLLDNQRYAFEAARALGRTAARAAVAPLLKLASAGSEASVRVAALALSELCERHAQLYGVATAIESLLRESRSEQLVRRLGQSASGADSSEKIALCRVLGALQDGASAQWLVPLLDGPSDVATAASAALAELGRDSDAAVERALLMPHSARRAVLLPSVQQPEHARAVLACLDDPEPLVRSLAAEALARIGYAAATPSLFALLGDENPRVVLSVSAAIQAIGGEHTEQLALAAARSQSSSVRRAALRILAYFGYESALAPFLAALKDPDPRLREAAMQGLSLLSQPEARDALLQAAESGDDKTRASSLRALGQSEPDEHIIAKLSEALGDPDAWARYYACQSLGRLHALGSAPAIVRLLDDPAGQVRVAAVEALSQLSGELSLAALHAATSATDPDVQRAALVGLGLAKDPGSLALLIERARAGDPATRLVALSALANFDVPEVTAALTLAARDDDESVRTAAVGFLQSASGSTASDALVALLPDLRTRARAMTALASPSKPPTARIESLVHALDAADEELAPLLVSCLSRLERVFPSDGLFRALISPNRRARLAAAHGLAALGTRMAYSALARASVEDSDPEVRRVCALHLAA